MKAVLQTGGTPAWAHDLGFDTWALAPVAGRPLLEYWLELCDLLRITEVRLVLSDGAQLAATARRIAAVKAASSVTVWSDELITSTGSVPTSSAASAASVTAGAVLRPTGSSRTATGSTLSSINWSSTRKRCSSLPTTIGAATSMPSLASPRSRDTDAYPLADAVAPVFSAIVWR